MIIKLLYGLIGLLLAGGGAVVLLGDEKPATPISQLVACSDGTVKKQSQLTATAANCSKVIDVVEAEFSAKDVDALQKACAPCPVTKRAWGPCPRCITAPGGCAKYCSPVLTEQPKEPR